MKNAIVLLTAVCLAFWGCNKDGGPNGFASSESGSGEGGSMAAMTISGNYMYRIAGGGRIEVYDISADTSAILVWTVDGFDDMETLFPYGNYLLAGTQSGMLIYDISNGAKPVYVSRYNHVVSCDPVVAQGKYAYVTLRNGTECARGLNQLEVLDLSNIQSPQLVKTVSMIMPHGLDADGNNMIVCEGPNGFKWMDLSNPANPVQKYFVNNVPGYDVISLGSTFILVGQNGLYQYKYGSSQPELLSQIPVQ